MRDYPAADRHPGPRQGGCNRPEDRARFDAVGRATAPALERWQEAAGGPTAELEDAYYRAVHAARGEYDAHGAIYRDAEDRAVAELLTT